MAHVGDKSAFGPIGGVGGLLSVTQLFGDLLLGCNVLKDHHNPAEFF